MELPSGALKAAGGISATAWFRWLNRTWDVWSTSMFTITTKTERTWASRNKHRVWELGHMDLGAWFRSHASAVCIIATNALL